MKSGLVVTVLLLSLVLVFPGLAQEPGSGRAQPEFPDLVAGLKAIPGNLGVETARTESGKQVIFAWFEDKAALLRWYYSDMHRGVQDRFFPNRPPRTPLQHIPEGTGPLLAIASITFADAAHFEQTQLPISQIAIELYQPLPGGLSLGGKFAPDALTVPHMIGPAEIEAGGRDDEGQ